MGLAACCAEGLGEERGLGEEGGLVGDLLGFTLDGSVSGVIPARQQDIGTCVQGQGQHAPIINLYRWHFECPELDQAS